MMRIIKLIVMVLFLLPFNGKTADINSLGVDSLPAELIEFVELFPNLTETEKNQIFYYAANIEFRIRNPKKKKEILTREQGLNGGLECIFNISNNKKIKGLYKLIKSHMTLTEKRKLAYQKTAYYRDRKISVYQSVNKEVKEQFCNSISPQNFTLFRQIPKGSRRLLADLNITPQSSIPESVKKIIDSMSFLTELEKTQVIQLVLLMEFKIKHFYDHKLIAENAQKNNVEVCIEDLNYKYKLRKNKDFVKIWQLMLSTNPRKIANKIYDGVRIKTGFVLPRQWEKYCDSIKIKNLRTFKLPDKQPSKQKHEFIHANNFIKYLQKSEKVKNYLRKQIVTVDSMATDYDTLLLMEGYDFYVNLACMKDHLSLAEDNEFNRAIDKDLKQQNRVEQFNLGVNKSFWWLQTLAMREQETPNVKPRKKLFDHFKCGQDMAANIAKQKNEQKKENLLDSNEAHNMNLLFTVYTVLFKDKSTNGLDNKQAIALGLIPRRMLNKNGEIVSDFGGKVRIEGVGEQGIKITYFDVPNGKPCSHLSLMVGNVHVNGKIYKGVEHIVINGVKISIKQKQFAKQDSQAMDKACAASSGTTSTISFVKENPIELLNKR